MASRWAEKLPVVSVPKGTPKRITLVYPYYQNAQFFAEQCTRWETACPVEYRGLVTVIVVDDGSPVPAVKPTSVPFRVRLFRIQQDVPWNWLAARNIGAYQAAEGWILLTDMDHVVPPETFRALIEGLHVEGFAYALSRREHTGEAITPHSASFFLTRKTFWSTGGYDEALSGHYGTDGDFRRRLAGVAPIEVLTDALVRFEHVGDSSTSRYQRKMPKDQIAVRRIVQARGTNWHPKALSFPYQEVAC